MVLRFVSTPNVQTPRVVLDSKKKKPADIPQRRHRGGADAYPLCADNDTRREYYMICIYCTPAVQGTRTGL